MDQQQRLTLQTNKQIEQLQLESNKKVEYDFTQTDQYVSNAATEDNTEPAQVKKGFSVVYLTKKNSRLLF